MTPQYFYIEHDEKKVVEKPSAIFELFGETFFISKTSWYAGLYCAYEVKTGLKIPNSDDRTIKKTKESAIKTINKFGKKDLLKAINQKLR